MSKYFPTHGQWQKWTLPSQASYIGSVFGVLSIILAIIFFYSTKNQAEVPVEEENVTLTILEFGSDTNIDHFYIDFLLRNDCSEDIIIKNISLFFSHNKFRGGSPIPAETDNFIVPTKSYIKKRLIFGKGREELWLHFLLYSSESSYHLGLQFLFYSEKISPGILIYPITSTFIAQYKLGGYSYTGIDNLPVTLQILPIDKISPKILRYPSDIRNE